MATRSDAPHLSALELRARLGSILDRVRLRMESFVIERKGEELAAIVPVSKLHQLEDFARRHARAVMERMEREGLGEDEVDPTVAEAVRETRGKRGRRQR